MPQPANLRAAFPALESVAYLNAGTMGPVPKRAADAAAEWLEIDVTRGRSSQARWDWMAEHTARLRTRLAALLGCDAGEMALTRATTDGVNAALVGIELGPGDSVVTSDEEHPGLMAPLKAHSRRRGFEIRDAPFAEVASAVNDDTKLVAVSHISWITGRVVDVAALNATGVPLLLDGAQGVGAVPLDMSSLGCDYYAASGQKWLCGPEQSGCLYVRGGGAGIEPPWPGYPTLKDPARAAAADWHDDARRFDTAGPPAASLAWAHAALDVFEESGWEAVFERAAALTRHLERGLRAHGAETVSGAGSTLVSWHSDDPKALVALLEKESIVVRALPGRDLVRASVGAWSTEDELNRVAEVACRA